MLISIILRNESFCARKHIGIANLCTRASFFVIFLVYPSTSAKVFSVFNCETLDDALDGSDRWLRADLSIDCNAPDRAAYTAYACLMLVIYPVSRTPSNDTQAFARITRDTCGVTGWRPGVLCVLAPLEAPRHIKPAPPQRDGRCCRPDAKQGGEWQDLGGECQDFELKVGRGVEG